MAKEAESTQKEAVVETRDADEFASLLKQSFKLRTERATTEVENAVTTLVCQALADTTVIKEDVLDTIGEMIIRIDEKLTAQVNEMIHAPEFQQIESAWRGLHYLVFNSETDSMLKIRVLNASKNELYRNLRRFGGAQWDRSALFYQLYETEFGQVGGEPFAALVGDYYFSHLPADIQLLKDISKIASTAHCPFIAGAEPALLGMDSWIELSKLRDMGTIFDAPEYAAWKGLRDSDDSRYIGLCMPRVLGRLPYGAKSEMVEEFAFEEDTDGHRGDKYGWINAAYAMAANINRAFKKYGWCTRIRGLQSGGEVINLPTHTFPTDDGDVDLKYLTEIAIGDRREYELAKSGLIPFGHLISANKAGFFSAQSVYRPKFYLGANGVEATASDNLSARLPYIFAAARFAHHLKCMVRDKVGSFMEKDELQRWLQGWITEYIDDDPANSSETTKAKKPLADANIKITADEENPGFYNAIFYLRPHYQLEGADIGMSLFSRLAG